MVPLGEVEPGAATSITVGTGTGAPAGDAATGCAAALAPSVAPAGRRSTPGGTATRIRTAVLSPVADAAAAPVAGRRGGGSADRRRMLKEAVSRRSGVCPLPQTPVSDIAPCRDEPPRPSLVNQANPLKSGPQPLFPPLVLVIGDSIIKHVRYFNAITHCLPGATVPILHDRLTSLLPSLPTSVHTIVVHIGTNDTARAPSEHMAAAFRKLFQFLKTTVIFISGPIPTFRKGDVRFSRLFSLSTWLRTASCGENLGFIDNFDLFWERASFYSLDGLHPSMVGTDILAENIRRAVPNVERISQIDCMFQQVRQAFPIVLLPPPFKPSYLKMLQPIAPPTATLPSPEQFLCR